MQAGRPGTQLDPYFSLFFNHKLVSGQTQKKVRGNGTIQSEEEGSQIPDSGRGWNPFIITVRYEEGSYPDH